MTIFVLGVHRSGTSCVAGTLHHLGLPVGTRLMGQGPRNPKGFFEDMDFVDLVVRYETEGDTPALRDRMRALVAQRDRRHALWGVKVPGLAPLLPWVAPLASAYRCVDVRRDPCAVAVSNVRAYTDHHQGEGRDVTLPMLANYLQDIAKLSVAIDAVLAATDQPVLSVAYEALLAQPDVWLRRLADFAGLTPTAAQWKAAREFVTPALNHVAV